MNHEIHQVTHPGSTRMIGSRFLFLCLFAGFLLVVSEAGFGQVNRKPSTTIQKTSTGPLSTATAHAQMQKPSPEQIRAKLLGKPKPTMGQRVTNPHAIDRLAHSAIISILIQQMKTGQAERSSIQLASSTAHTAGAQTNTSHGAPGAMNTEARRPPSHGMLNPADISNTLTQGIQARQNDCALGKTVLMTVNGKSGGTVFTQDPSYNLYTIRGCNFGTQQGQLHLYGAFKTGQVPLLVNFWGDNSIVAAMDPNLSGEIDQSNVHLVLVLANGQQFDQGGEQFYAARDITTLPSIPFSWITFGQVRDASNWPLVPDNRATLPSIIVSRTSTDRFSGGQDYYDFSRLKPGFTTYSYQFGSYSIDCTDDARQTTLYTDGSFQPQWDGDNIRITLGAQTCHFGPYALLPAYDEAASSYILAVQVSGPRGVDPLN